MITKQPRSNKLRYLAIGSICVIGLYAIIGSGGPRYVYRASPYVQTSTNDFFEAKISPLCPSGCKAFQLTIENKTDKDIELDWNKTLYISNGTTSGGFMFEGVVYIDRNNPKSPDIVFSKSTFSKTIWPNNLVYYSSGKHGRWRNKDMPTGENGVYLTVKVNGEEIKEKITIDIIREQVQQ
jgi:hypothetical protein